MTTCIYCLRDGTQTTLKLGTWVIFQLLYGRRQRRLLDVQSLGCMGEMQLFSNCKKTSKMTQLHRGIYSEGILSGLMSC